MKEVKDFSVPKEIHAFKDPVNRLAPSNFRTKFYF